MRDSAITHVRRTARSLAASLGTRNAALSDTRWHRWGPEAVELQRADRQPPSGASSTTFFRSVDLGGAPPLGCGSHSAAPYSKRAALQPAADPTSSVSGSRLLSASASSDLKPTKGSCREEPGSAAYDAGFVATRSNLMHPPHRALSHCANSSVAAASL